LVAAIGDLGDYKGVSSGAVEALLEFERQHPEIRISRRTT
jgi:hypothetical protein